MRHCRLRSAWPGRPRSALAGKSRVPAYRVAGPCDTHAMQSTKAKSASNGALLVVLFTVGVVLTVGDVVLVAVLVGTTPPPWLWSLLAVSPWGPIALLAWWFIRRHRRRVRFMQDNGIPARATITAIRTTGSSINSRPVLLLDVLVAVPARPVYQATVRTAPPIHLAGMLRPGVGLPVKVDPGRPEQLLVDWAQAERETSPAR
jgi:hypothetical protein